MQTDPTQPVLVLPDQLFDGIADRPQTGMAVEVRGTLITDVRPATAQDRAAPKALRADIAAPGFVDLQINGGGDVLFNDAPDSATLGRIAAAARRGGTAWLLPTFITQSGVAYQTAIAAVAAAMAEGMPGILGVHLEGPFISPGRPGIHPEDAIRPLRDTDLAALCAPHPGKILITLAPEQAPPGAVRRLADAGAIVFVGHSMASYDDVMRAAVDGLCGGTHLFNAMTQCLSRDPGVVGALMDHGALFAGIIADGHHVHPSNLRLALGKMGPDRLFLVTDAMASLGGVIPGFNLLGKDIRLQDGMLTDAEGRLAGAHLAMDEAVRNMMAFCGTSPAVALRMASTTPARALGLGDELGIIRTGARAGITLLTRDFQTTCVMTDGVVFPKTTALA